MRVISSSAFLLSLSVLSPLMVFAMVRFNSVIVAEPGRRSAINWWGITYAVTWAAIIILLLQGAVAAGIAMPRAVAGVTLVAVGWGTFHALWLRLWLSLERSNARGTQTETISPFHEVIRHRAGQLAIGGLVVVALAFIRLGYFRDILATMLASGHRSLAATLTIAVAGFTLLVLGGARLVLSQGKPMSHAEIEEQFRAIKYGPQGRTGPLSYSRSIYRIFGPAQGAQAEQQVSLHAMKEAWRSGAWWRDSMWRTLFMMTAGGLMMIFGGFASFVVADPAVVKAFAGGALAYTTFQLIAAVRRA